MPRCQFLFSAVFGFRKVTYEIFSESDEIKAKNHDIPEDSGSQKGSSRGPQGAHTLPRRGPPLAALRVGVAALDRL